MELNEFSSEAREESFCLDGAEFFNQKATIENLTTNPGVFYVERRIQERITIVKISTFKIVDSINPSKIHSYAVEYTLDGKRLDNYLHHGTEQIKKLFSHSEEISIFKSLPCSFWKESSKK